ncbi:hypothetical protein [Neobacillus niacini]|jgi:hypothetical protein|uniref:hypothetical protein n=1 Tax=Neobacillus niacini TaxID=86668 RepID=UPI001C8F0E01|nr:hypothetical protein [Neobacillus niacini]MBY0148203.1 hypothetical protein [Neobacillus niacini]
MMFETFMIHKYFKGTFIGKTYYQGATRKSLEKVLARGYRDGELRSWKIVHFDEARVYKLIDSQEEYVETLTKFKSLPMA